MVVNCVAYGCKNVYSKDRSIQFHTFPFKRPAILQLWINAIRRESWKPARTSRLCSQHFKESDYQIRPGSAVKLLKLGAVPTVFNFPKHLRKHSNERRVLDYCNREIELDYEEQPREENIVAVPPAKKNVQTQTLICNLQLNRMRRQIKTLKQMVHRRDEKIRTMKGLIQRLKENQCSSANLEMIVENYPTLKVFHWKY